VFKTLTLKNVHTFVQVLVAQSGINFKQVFWLVHQRFI